MKISEAINMAVMAVASDTTLDDSQSLDIIHALTVAEENTEIAEATLKAFKESHDGLFIRTKANKLPDVNFLNVDGLLDWSRSKEAHKCISEK